MDWGVVHGLEAIMIMGLIRHDERACICDFYIWRGEMRGCASESVHVYLGSRNDVVRG